MATVSKKQWLKYEMAKKNNCVIQGIFFFLVCFIDQRKLSKEQNNSVIWGFFLFHRLLVEKIFAQYLVPHNLETEERMKCLYYLYASLDPNAVK